MQAQGAGIPYALGQIYATGAHKKKVSSQKKKKNPQKKRVSNSA